MKPIQILRRTVDVVTVVLVLAAVYFWASTKYFPTKTPTLRWEESVVLPDQRIVVLKREQHFDEGGYVGAHSFEFQHPVTKQTVNWQSDGFFRLVAVFMVQDTPLILLQPTFGIHNEWAGCPYPSMFIYKYNGANWQQIPYAESPVREIKNNTTMDPKLDRDYITASHYQIPAGGVKIISHPSDQHYYGINLEKFPAQIFQCPSQKRLNFQ